MEPPAITKQAIVEKLSRLLPIISERFRVRSIFLFGSAARNEIKPESDIDILADFQEDADLFNLTALGDFLEVQLGRRVDVISKRALRSEIKESVFKDAVLI